MSISLVQHAQNSTNAGTTSLSVTVSSTTAGNCIVVAFSADTNAAISSVHLGAGADNFSQLASAVNASGSAYVWADPNCAGGQTTVTITFGSAPNVILADVYEFSGLATSAVLDKSATANGTSSSWSSGATATSTQAAEAWVGVGFVNRFTLGDTITGPSSPWTNETSQVLSFSGGSRMQVSGYQITSSTGAATYSGTSTGGTVAETAAVVVTLLPPASTTSTGSVALKTMALSGTALGGNTTSGSVALPTMALSGSGLTASPFPAQPLGSKIELLINGTWTDITQYVYNRADISITYGRNDEASTISPAQCTMTINNRDGRFTPKNSAGAYYPYITRNTQLRVSVTSASSSGDIYTGYRFWGEVSSWPVKWDPSGTDVYVEITASGILRRLQQGQSRNLGSTLYRYYTSLTGSSVPLAYWPCEDPAGATQFASAISGGSAMGWTGTPALAADSNVNGSLPFAQLNGSTWTGTTSSLTWGSGLDVYTTPGTYTWTAPGGTTSLTSVECWGGGGGGGGGSRTINASDGSDGGFSRFTGNAVTVTAHGGIFGGPGLNGGFGTGGAGGTGSTNTTHHNGGAGASGSGGGSGGGGGGSGGSSANGNTATTNAGATAVTGGGPGGDAGMLPATGPGGGGGAGDTGGAISVAQGGGGGGGEYAKETSVAVTPGNEYTVEVAVGGAGGVSELVAGSGYAGEVKLTYTPSSIPASNVLRFLLDLPLAGGTDGAILAQMTTTGTVATVKVQYNAIDGTIQLLGYNSTPTLIFDSGPSVFVTDGDPRLVSVELTTNGANVNWKLAAVQAGGALDTATGSVAGSMGAPSTVTINSGGTETSATGVGHITVQGAVVDITAMGDVLAAYAAERAGTRFTRLCTEQGISGVLTGNTSDTPQMGPQGDKTFMELIQEVEDLDRGLLYEQRDAFGLGYRTRVSMQNQTAVATYDYSAADLADSVEPIYDDQYSKNDITVTRTGGSSATSVLSTGSMSTQDPPNGIGDYPASYTVNAHADSQLANLATWLMDIGTVDEDRYPSITIDLTRSEVASVFSDTASLTVGDFLKITNPPAWLPSGDIKQLAYGFKETLSNYKWTIEANAVPESVYEGMSLPSW